MGEENRRVVKRGLKHNGQWGPSHGPRRRGKGSRERRRGNIQNRADETEWREGENKWTRRRKFFGEGRERKEEQTLVPLIQFSMAAAEPLEGRWMFRVTCEGPNPGL